MKTGTWLLRALVLRLLETVEQGGASPSWGKKKQRVRRLRLWLARASGTASSGRFHDNRSNTTSPAAPNTGQSVSGCVSVQCCIFQAETESTLSQVCRLLSHSLFLWQLHLYSSHTRPNLQSGLFSLWFNVNSRVVSRIVQISLTRIVTCIHSSALQSTCSKYVRVYRRRISNLDEFCTSVAKINHPLVRWLVSEKKTKKKNGKRVGHTRRDQVNTRLKEILSFSQ